MAEDNSKTMYDNLLELIGNLSDQMTNLSSRVDSIGSNNPTTPVEEAKSADECFVDWLKTSI